MIKEKEKNESEWETIDLEPKWVDLLRSYNHMAEKDLSVFESACNIADIVRQAQKSGKTSVTFMFGEDGSCEVEINPE